MKFYSAATEDLRDNALAVAHDLRKLAESGREIHDYEVEDAAGDLEAFVAPENPWEGKPITELSDSELATLIDQMGRERFFERESQIKDAVDLCMAHWRRSNHTMFLPPTTTPPFHVPWSPPRQVWNQPVPLDKPHAAMQFTRLVVTVPYFLRHEHEARWYAEASIRQQVERLENQ